MPRSVISEFESRRVQRFLRDLFLGKMRLDEEIAVTGDVDGHWLRIHWEFANATRTLVYGVDARVDTRAERLREREAIDLLYDLLGAQFDEFLTTRDPFTGANWEEAEFAGKKVWLRGQIYNDSAENSATSLLDADAAERSRALADEPDAAENDA